MSHSDIDPEREQAELAEAQRRGHEARDIGFRQFLVLGIALIAVGIVGNLVLLPVFNMVQRRQEQSDVPPPPLARATQVPPRPHLQVAPELEWDQFLATQNETLTTYGWADESRQSVRIPIDRAMDLVLERGMLPVRPDAGQFAAERTSDYGTNLDSEGGQPPGTQPTTSP
jgi:hypothetical protein